MSSIFNERIFHIEVETDAKIELDISGVDMEYHWNCSYDFIQGNNPLMKVKNLNFYFSS